MVYTPTRGDLPPRLGPEVQQVPDYGPRVMPRDGYTDPMQFELERHKVLRTHWLIACRSSDIANPGDWTSYEGHGETAVIVRQADGSVKGFHNVCRHRGPAIVTEWSGCGSRRFTCPYHGWVYDTTGKLVGVPEREDFDPVHLAGVRSPEVAAEEWGGWVWINLSGPDAPTTLAEALGAEIMADLGAFRMEDMVVHAVATWDVPVSYKAVVDGFNEVYHTTELHRVPPEFTKAARGTSFHFSGDNYMQFVPRYQHLDELHETWDHHRYAICHYVAFPNTVFNCNPRHVQLFRPIPITVDSTRFECWELIYPGDPADPEYAQYLAATMEHWEELQRVVGEDIGIYQQLERTKRSPAYVEHILSERECKIARYHETMARKISE
ncbi:MAG: aromatic ring-hydroxylating dioxygenase subunit alpha [Ilumatobacteraceae bacterium]